MKKLTKRVLALLLALSMVAALAACGEKATSTPTAAPTGAGQTTDTPDPTSTPDVAKEYTYNYALSVFPTNWNIHTYQTSTDNDLMGYLMAGFYTFDYNETKDGYKLVPEMAVGDPVDVTAEYVGKYGIVEGDKNKVYKITLRNDMMWEDGTKIVAEDFVTSAKLLLAPEAQNYRADMLYSGTMPVYNAKNYLYQGQTVKLENASNAAYTFADLTKNDEGVYCTPDGGKVYWAIDYELATWLGGYSLKTYVEAYGAAYFDTTTWEQLAALADEDGLVPVTDDTYKLFAPITTGNPAWGETTDDLYAYLVYDETFPALDFSEVGLFATSDTELVYVSEKEITGFYLLYSLTGSWLVNEKLYKQCESIVDGVYQNSYCTSAETTISYGPYKLASFQNDKQYVLEKNEKYFGLTKDTYQTTRIQVDYVAEAATRLEMFINGQLDSYGLDANNMADYQSSDYTYYTTSPSTFFIALNPDLDALTQNQKDAGANINKTILTILEFRQALSFSLDRKAFALAVSPTNNAAFAIFSDIIISDPETGTAYRTQDAAKKVIVDFWGVADEIGEGKMYATVDDAIESITGYNLALAKEKFNEAYDKAIAAGLMTENDTIQIKIGTPNATSQFYSKGYEFLVNNYTKAVEGTKLEGKLTFVIDNTLGNGFGDALRDNKVDMLFGVGWNGSALDPYSLMEAYTKDSYRYNRSWACETENLTIELNGKKYTATIWDWTQTISGEEITVKLEDGTTEKFSAGTADNIPEERFTILASLEGAVLNTYEMIPMIDDSSAALKGMQIEYYTEDYIYGVGRGGVKYMTYNYSDAEWDEYVKAQGGSLNYK